MTMLIVTCCCGTLQMQLKADASDEDACKGQS